MVSRAVPQLGSLEVQMHDMLVATADGGDQALDEAVPQMLRLIRQRMDMDVVFVSEFTNGQRVFRHVAQPEGRTLLPEGAGDPLENSWCQRVVDGRIPQYIPDAAEVIESAALPVPPFPIGTHISTPIVLPDGRVFGTLCCFSFGVNPSSTQHDLEVLQYAAKLLSNIVEPQDGPA